MKKSIYLFVFLILISTCYAKMEIFQTTINITKTNDTCFVRSEDGQVRTYVHDANDLMTVNLLRNTSCNEEILYEYLIKQTNCEPKYLNCSVDLANCQAIAYDQTNSTYKSRYESCNSQLSSLQNQQASCSSCNSELNRTKSELNNRLLIGALIGGAVVWFFLSKRNPKPPVAKLPQYN